MIASGLRHHRTHATSKEAGGQVTVFSAREFRQHEQVAHLHDRETGLKTIIAIHDTTMGPSGGGCRMYPYESDVDALNDVLRLSRAMTYKLALIDSHFGGGKSVIIGDPKRDKTEALLRAFGRSVERLGGRYTVGEDVGITVDDMEIIRQETGYCVGLAGRSGDTSPPTAYGVYRGILAAVKHKLHRDGVDGVRVAVQGLGAVGYRLCDYLAKNGAKLLVADIDGDVVKRTVEAFGAAAIDPDEVITAEADVLAPCALGGVVNDKTLPRIKATVIAGAANNQLLEDRHAVILAERGILFAPDYIINSGGAINASAEGPDYDKDAVVARVKQIYDTLLDVFERADQEGRSTLEIADRMAEERLAAKRAEQAREQTRT
jgi:leucine dehydrogenase